MKPAARVQGFRQATVAEALGIMDDKNIRVVSRKKQLLPYLTHCLAGC